MVTAVLFAIAVPPTLPWWLTLIGMVSAIALVKQLYGGLGYNPFNPAMAAYVLLLISYPAEMTNWLAPELPGQHALSLLDSLRLILFGDLPAHLSWDALSAATPLEAVRTQLGDARTMDEIRAGLRLGCPRRTRVGMGQHRVPGGRGLSAVAAHHHLADTGLHARLHADPGRSASG